MGLFDSIIQAAGGTTQSTYTSILSSAGINIPDFKASLEGDALTITGTVPDGETADKAVNALSALPGVNTINNYLEVEDLTSQNVMLNVATEHSNLNLRKGPGTEFDVVGKAAHNSQVQLIKKMFNGWYYVKSADGTEGFSSTEYLK
jgi:uncharacterized protein YgiM (DUF1202 family)